MNLDQKSPRLLTELGATLFQNGNPAAAAKYLDQSLELDPSNLSTLKYAIGTAVATKNWARADLLFTRLDIARNVELLRREPILLLWLAQTMIETKRVEHFDSALSGLRSSMPPGLLFSIGTLFAQHGMYQRAIDYLEEISPESADAPTLFNLGLAYSHLHRFEQARGAYFATIDKNADNVNAYFHVGLDYASSGKPRMAIPWLYRAHALAPERSDITYALTEQLIGLEYYDSAKALVSKASTNTRPEPLLLVAEGDVALAKSDPGAAMRSYQAAVRLKPGFPAALVGLARADIALGKTTDARVLLQTAITNSPEDVSISGELGVLEEKDGNSRSALTHLERAWEQDQSNTTTALALARVYEREKRPTDALRVLSVLAPVIQDSPAYHLQLARLYTALHRNADAKAEQDLVNALQNRSHDGLHFESPGTYIH